MRGLETEFGVGEFAEEVVVEEKLAAVADVDGGLGGEQGGEEGQKEERAHGDYCGRAGIGDVRRL